MQCLNGDVRYDAEKVKNWVVKAKRWIEEWMNQIQIRTSYQSSKAATTSAWLGL
jgi:hypothetical protein